MVCGELSGALSAGAEDYWIINCGSIRPHCYILDLIAELWQNGDADADEHRRRYVGTYFGGDERIADLLRDFSEHTLQYGPHADEKAGEEIYHYPVRQLAAAWMCGETEQPLDELIWLCDEKPFPEQLEDYHALVVRALDSWGPYLERCVEVPPEPRFYDSIALQAIIHHSGALGASLFCESHNAACGGNLPRAFVLAWRAKEAYKQALDGFAKAEHGVWKGYYDNDCLTDVRLTVEILEKLMAWLRVQGEGADAHLWHRQYLMSEKDRRIVLILYTRRPLSDDMLAKELSKVL
jgi:hypothetical protein